jgi:hypothetical protein
LDLGEYVDVYSLRWNLNLLLGDRYTGLDGPDDLLLPVEVPDDVGGSTKSTKHS